VEHRSVHPVNEMRTTVRTAPAIDQVLGEADADLTDAQLRALIGHKTASIPLCQADDEATARGCPQAARRENKSEQFVRNELLTACRNAAAKNPPSA